MSRGVTLRNLNDPQRAIATTLDRPLFVEAGAGSGKTFTLTQRVAWALSPGSGVDGTPYLTSMDQVLVITFTRAAAREITERVRTTLRAAGLREHALAVDDAWISTIHAMCQRILKRFALDLGIDPDFTVATEAESEQLLSQELNVLLAEVRSAQGAEAQALAAYEKLCVEAKKSFNSFELLLSLRAAVANAPGGFAHVHAATPCPELIHDLLLGLSDVLKTLLSCELSAAAAPKVEAAYAAVKPLETKRPGSVPLEELVCCVEAIELPSRPSKAIAELLGEAKSLFAQAKLELALARPALVAPVLLQLAERFNARFEAAKRAAGKLENDDLVHLALLAVRECEPVRRAMARRFRLVMVDEFQDTDTEQLELISLLAGADSQHLCTVGDAQQSIYRFRGADVAVFRAHGAAIEKHPQGTTIKLDTNYRSHSDILSLVDRVCGGTAATTTEVARAGVMRGHMSLKPCHTRNDALVARMAPRVQLEVISGACGRGGKRTAEQARLSADQVADAFARLCEQGERPGDMALLLGATTKGPLYIEAMRARGLDCVVTGGSSFSEAPEVRLVNALLYALANPRDTRSGLFRILASDMFGLDATDFCLLASREQEGLETPAKRTIDQGLQELTLVGDVVPSVRLQRAHEVIERALAALNCHSIAEVAEQVVRESGWLSRLEEQGQTGLSVAANVLAALRFIYDLDTLGFGPAEAAREFEHMLNTIKIAPAQLRTGNEGGAGSISVMTIHASKGLEFPICAVAECWSNPRSDGGPLVVDDLMVLRPLDSKAVDHAKKYVDPEAYEPSADRSEQMSLSGRYLRGLAQDAHEGAEEKARLLYVGLTRAREVLILAIDAAQSKQGVSSKLAVATLEALGIDPSVTGEYELDYGGSAPARVRCVAPVDDESEKEQEAPVEQPVDAPTATFTTFATGPTGERYFSRTWRPREGVFSYSSLSREEQMPIKPAQVVAEVQAQAAESALAADEDYATNLGSAFHQLAQALVESGGNLPEGRLEACARQWKVRGRGIDRLREAFDRWVGSALRKETLSYELVRAEVPFFQAVSSSHGEYLEGAIDLLCTNPGSAQALLVDYKTGDRGLSVEEAYARHEKQARLYTEVLAREGLTDVTCAFVCVEREDEEKPGEPLVLRYRFEV